MNFLMIMIMMFPIKYLNHVLTKCPNYTYELEKFSSGMDTKEMVGTT